MLVEEVGYSKNNNLYITMHPLAPIYARIILNLSESSNDSVLAVTGLKKYGIVGAVIYGIVRVSRNFESTFVHDTNSKIISQLFKYMTD